MSFRFIADIIAMLLALVSAAESREEQTRHQLEAPVVVIQEPYASVGLCNTERFRPPELNDEELTALLVQYDWPVESMRHVARGESGILNPATLEWVYCFGSISVYNSDGSRDHCGFQINDHWWPQFDFEQLKQDPQACLEAAWEVYVKQGPPAWQSTWP